MRKSTDRKLLIISIFSVNKASGHSVYDDLFYYGILRKSGSPFSFFASPYSISRLGEVHVLDGDDVRPIAVDDRGLIATVKAVLSIPVSRDSRIVFLGYSEKFLLVFFLLNVLKKYELVIVATNNFSAGRIAKYGNTLKLLFRLINRRLKKVVVHTDKERAMCSLFGEEFAAKAIVKKHHLMIPRQSESARAPSDRQVVLFLGPEKHDKPIRPMIDLIKKDVSKLFDYRFLNVDKDRVVADYDIRPGENIQFINKWLSEQEYFAEFLNASFIMMSHDKSFEGKLSGNLCDCISLGVPFISSDIEPVRSYFNHYGPIGYVYNFSDPQWAASFLVDFSPEVYEGFRNNFKKINADHERSIVEEDNIKALLQ